MDNLRYNKERKNIMGNEKSHKKYIDENIETLKKIEEEKPQKVTKRILSFDIYFQILMKKGASAHHKAPMRKYAEQNNLIEATEEDFNRIFKKY